MYVCLTTDSATRWKVRIIIKRDAYIDNGFRRGLSTITQILELTHEVAYSIDSEKQTDRIFLDFAKAFDQVSHMKLLKKLEVALWNSTVIKWINKYLTNRFQYVEFNNQTLDVTPSHLESRKAASWLRFVSSSY